MWEFFPQGRGGNIHSHFINHTTTQKVNIFVKTKNVPNVLKCKINHLNQQTIFFLHKHGVPKLGGGGGVSDLGNIPTFSRFFWQTSLT